MKPATPAQRQGEGDQRGEGRRLGHRGDAVESEAAEGLDGHVDDVDMRHVWPAAEGGQVVEGDAQSL